MQDMKDLTPRRIVELLDEHIVGQDKAKRAVAVALRNRWRRQQLPPEEAAEIYPKNILLVGPTGVGKTEISRRLAALAGAPFLKVEASRFSEVGYHGRDVESMVRDLVESAIAMVRREEGERVAREAAQAAEERLFRALARARGLEEEDEEEMEEEEGGLSWQAQQMQLFQTDNNEWLTPPPGLEDTPGPEEDPEARARRKEEREKLLQALRSGELEGEEIEIPLEDRSKPTLDIQSGQGTESMAIDTRALQELWGRAVGPRFKLRRLTVREARAALIEEETDKLIDKEGMIQKALTRCENDGIIFLDEIDKIVGANPAEGPDVSREGVQRDLLPIVEGASVFTKYGYVRTDHILFIGAGAFSTSKPADLIPELQGRFPVRVALTPLTKEDLARILTEPKNALTKQYARLLSTEGVELEFTQDGIQTLAEVAAKANFTTQDIGARRLMTLLEKLLEDISFEAPEKSGTKVVVDRNFVTERLGDAGDDDDLMPYRI